MTQITRLATRSPNNPALNGANLRSRPAPKSLAVLQAHADKSCRQAQTAALQARAGTGVMQFGLLSKLKSLGRGGGGGKKGKGGGDDKKQPPSPSSASASSTKSEGKSDEQKFLEAYEAARFYHHSRNASNLGSIAEHGLLNQKDRLANQNVGEVGGMSAIGGEYEGDEEIGVFLGERNFYEENENMRNLLRLFLPGDQTERPTRRHPATLVPRQKNTAPTDPNLTYWDAKFPGGRVRENSVPADQVLMGSLDQISDDNQPSAKQAAIVQAIQSNWVRLHGEPAPSPARILELMRQLMRQRRLSISPLDPRPGPDNSGGGKGPPTGGAGGGLVKAF